MAFHDVSGDVARGKQKRSWRETETDLHMCLRLSRELEQEAEDAAKMIAATKRAIKIKRAKLLKHAKIEHQSQEARQDQELQDQELQDQEHAEVQVEKATEVDILADRDECHLVPPCQWEQMAEFF